MIATTLDTVREIRLSYTGRERRKASDYIDSTNAVGIDQLWFWTEEWQAGERKVEEYIQDGNVQTFDTAEEFLRTLRE